MAEKDAKTAADAGAGTGTDAAGGGTDGTDTPDPRAEVKGMVKEAISEWTEENKPTSDKRGETTDGWDWFRKVLGI